MNRYTLTVGKPPFQSKDVKAIYNRIRENRYDFPVDKPISSSAQDLIISLLNPNPGKSHASWSMADAEQQNTVPHSMPS